MPPRESEMEYLTRIVDWLVENEVYRAVIAANSSRPLPRNIRSPLQTVSPAMR